MAKSRGDFTDVLVKRKILSPEQVDEARAQAKAGKKIQDVLVAMQYATAKEILSATAEFSNVEYEDLEPIFDVEEAIKPDAVPLKPHGTNHFIYEGHECRRVRLGDVEKGFAEADHIFEYKYSSKPIEQAPTETTGCIVEPKPDGRLKIYSNTQAAFFTLDGCSLLTFNTL